MESKTPEKKPKEVNDNPDLNALVRYYVLNYLKNNLEDLYSKKANDFTYTDVSFEDLDDLGIEWEHLKAKQVAKSLFFEHETEKSSLNLNSQELIDLKKEIINLSSEFLKLKNENLRLKKSFVDLVGNSVFVHDKKIQFIETEIYIDSSESEVIIDAYSSVLKALNHLGFEADVELPGIKGSWYKKLIAKSKTVLSSEEVVSRLKEVEYALEVNGILKQQSEIDKNQSEALANIIKSTEGSANAYVRLGSIVVIKTTDPQTNVVNTQVFTLTVTELHFLNKNPQLSRDPLALQNALLNLKSHNPDNLLDSKN